jgi:hypothetical protein
VGAEDVREDHAVAVEGVSGGSAFGARLVSTAVLGSVASAAAVDNDEKLTAIGSAPSDTPAAAVGKVPFGELSLDKMSLAGARLESVTLSPAGDASDVASDVALTSATPRSDAAELSGCRSVASSKFGCRSVFPISVSLSGLPTVAV